MSEEAVRICVADDGSVRVIAPDGVPVKELLRVCRSMGKALDAQSVHMGLGRLRYCEPVLDSGVLVMKAKD